MPAVSAVVECPVYDSFRVAQVSGMFDCQVGDKCREEFSVEVPGLDEDWQVGVIVGPSGSGKSTIASHVYGDALYRGAAWPDDKAVVDCFGELSIKEITHALTAVGFSSPPSWVKPYRVLSNGEKFRCDLARSLLADTPLVAFDEFSSVVDRTVAKIGSAAVSKAIRSGKIKRRFVAVTCHYDVVEWLEPDWVVDMASRTLVRGRLRRPAIDIQVRRIGVEAWKLFKKHHYLTANINPSAVCFVGFVDGVPAVFDAWLPFVGRLKDARKARRGHRTVCLPDFQGVGIGGAMFASNASLWTGLGYRAFSCTAHPAEIRNRLKNSHLWRVTQMPSMTQKDLNKSGRRSLSSLHKTRASSRLTASFEFIGPAMERSAAERCLTW